MLTVLASIVLAANSQGAPSDRDVHPLWTLDEYKLRTYWDKGYRAGKNTRSDPEKLLDFLRTDMGTVRSPAGEKWRASYVAPLPPIAKMESAGFDAARRLETSESESRRAIREQREDRENPDRTLSFEVVLNAWPSLGIGGIRRRANAKDVRATDFVLSIDGETVRLQGYDRKSQDSERGDVTLWTQSEDRNRRHKRNSTVTYWDRQVQGYDAYHATYLLEFPFYDDRGRPYIDRRTRNVTLRVITEGLTRDVKIDLDKLADKMD
jgi:hypothetical protein